MTTNRARQAGGPVASAQTAAELARAASERMRPKVPANVLASDESADPEEAAEARKARFHEGVAEGAGKDVPPPGIVDLDTEGDESSDDPDRDMSGPLPEWAILPPEIKLPRGWIVWAIRIRGQLTNTPKLGDRWCLVWNLTEGDQKRAAKRARGDAHRVIDELAKQMIRVIGTVGSGPISGESHMADWSGSLTSPGSVDAFWSLVGGKYQHALRSLYLKNHTFSTDEQLDFFENCVLPRTVG